MRIVDWFRGRRLDDELDGSISDLFTSMNAAEPSAANGQARVRARVAMALGESTRSRRFGWPAVALFGAGGALTSLWTATASHRVAVAVAAAAILLGSGMAAEASGLGPSLREVVQDAVQGEQEPGSAAVRQAENASENALGAVVVEPSEEIAGNLIRHVGGSGHLHMRAILEAIIGGDPGTVAVDGADGIEVFDLAADARIQIPGQKSEDPIADLQTLLGEEDPLVVLIEGTCTDGQDAEDCVVTRVTVLGHSRPEQANGPPEGVGAPEGAGKPEGVTQGKPGTKGKPAGTGKPEGTPPDED